MKVKNVLNVMFVKRENSSNIAKTMMKMFLVLLFVSCVEFSNSSLSLRTQARQWKQQRSTLDIDSDLDFSSARQRLGRARCTLNPSTFRNGQVRFRLGGTVARFRCDQGFELIGQPTALCLRRNRWSNPVPICGGRQCRGRPKAPTNGRAQVNYQGASLHFLCNPGHRLQGSRTIYCVDNDRWNGSTPLCLAERANGSLSCDFEDNLCSWLQDTESLEWRRHRSARPDMMSATSNWVQYDHTLGNGSSGYALRVEQSVDGSEDEARLFSPVLEPEMSGSCLSIWYHVNDGTGRHSGGSLRIYVKTEDKDLSETEASLNISSIKRTQSSSSPLNSSNSAQWTLALVDIPNVRVAFQVIIVAGLSHGFDGDIAIDDVDLVAANCSAVLAERFTLAVDNGLANNGSSGQWPSGQFAPDNATDDTWSPWLNSSASCENKCNQSSIALTGGQVGGPSLLVDTCSCSTLCKQETNCCPNYDQFCGSGPGSDDYRDHISSPVPDAGQSSGTPTVSPTQQFDTGDSSRTGSPLVEQTWTENAMSPTSPSSLPTPAIRIELSTSEPSSTKGSTTLTQIFPSNSTAGVHKLDTESDITGSASSSSIGKVRTERVDENQTHSSHDSSSFTPDTENSSGVRTTLAILTNISSGTTDAYITNSLDTSTSSSSSVSSQLAQNSTRQVSSVTSKQILDSSTDPSGDSKHVAENSTTTKSSVESQVAFSSTTTTVPTTVTTSRQTTMAASLDRSSTSRTSPRTTVQIEVNTEPVTSSINKQFKVPELDDEEDIGSKVKLPEGRSAGPSEQLAVKRDPNVRSEWNGQMVKEQAVMAAERKATDDHNQEANITGNGHVIWPLTILTVLMVSLLLGLFELRRRRRRTSTDSDIIGLLSLN